MKKVLSHPIPRFFFVNAMCSILMMVSCEEDSPKVLPSVVQFSANLQNVVEGDEATVLLTLDRPAPGNGSVELTIETNAVYGQHFKSDPTLSNNTIVLQIEKGEKTAEFKITTVDNEKYEGTRFIIFQLKSRSDDLRLGDITALTFTIGDDEGPSVANFAVSSAFVNETDKNGILIEIALSAPAKGEGSVTVTLNPGKAVNKTNFTIDQELNNGSFSFNVTPNTRSVSFKVFPVDNDLFTANLILVFSITEISGVVHKGNSPNYSLSIVDDERPSVAKFALSSGMLAETNGDGIIVEILLSSPVKGEGTIQIIHHAGDAVYGTDFTTVPEAINNRITLSLVHGQASASFSVFPINNDLLKENLVRSFSISEVSGVIWKDSKDVGYTLAFVDDEKPSIANFAVSSATVDQINSEGMEVQIQFSNPAAGTGKIIVDVVDYTFNFTSDPKGVETYEVSGSYYYSYVYTYRITLDVAQYAESASFKIFPLMNADTRCSEAGRTIFAIAAVSGVIRNGENQMFDLTVNHDAPTIVTLTEKEGTLNENDAAGKEIILNFSKPAVADGSIAVSIGFYAGYTERHTTIPEFFYDSGSGYYAFFNFKKDDNSVQFKALPINDNIANGNITGTFNVSARGQDGCVKIQDPAYKLTIDDDDD